MWWVHSSQGWGQLILPDQCFLGTSSWGHTPWPQCFPLVPPSNTITGLSFHSSLWPWGLNICMNSRPNFVQAVALALQKSPYSSSCLLSNTPLASVCGLLSSHMGLSPQQHVTKAELVWWQQSIQWRMRSYHRLGISYKCQSVLMIQDKLVATVWIIFK